MLTFLVSDLTFKFHASDLPYLCDFCYNEILTEGVTDADGNAVHRLCSCEARTQARYETREDDDFFFCCECMDTHADVMQEQSGIDVDRRFG